MTDDLVGRLRRRTAREAAIWSGYAMAVVGLCPWDRVQTGMGILGCCIIALFGARSALTPEPPHAD